MSLKKLITKWNVRISVWAKVVALEAVNVVSIKIEETKQKFANIVVVKIKRFLLLRSLLDLEIEDDHEHEDIGRDLTLVFVDNLFEHE